MKCKPELVIILSDQKVILPEWVPNDEYGNKMENSNIYCYANHSFRMRMINTLF